MAIATASFHGVCFKDSAQVQVDIKGWLGERDHFTIEIVQPLLETATRAEFINQELWLLDKLDLPSVQMLCGIMDDISLKVFEQPYFLKPKTLICDLEQRFYNYYNLYTRG